MTGNPDIPAHMSPIKQEVARLLNSMEPNRMDAALRQIKRLDDRIKGGMSAKEAARLMWQEAIDEGVVDREAAPPEVRELLVATE